MYKEDYLPGTARAAKREDFITFKDIRRIEVS
jgi:hypothetical protein